MADNTNYCAAKRFIYVWEGPVRITHWVNVFSIIILSITGYYIHNPFIDVHDMYYPPYIMGTVRYIHYLTGIIFAVSVIIRLYWLFVGNRYASWHSFANPFNKKDRKILMSYFKYYIFLEKNPPHTLTQPGGIDGIHRTFQPVYPADNYRFCPMGAGKS